MSAKPPQDRSSNRYPRMAVAVLRKACMQAHPRTQPTQACSAAVCRLSVCLSRCCWLPCENNARAALLLLLLLVTAAVDFSCNVFGNGEGASDSDIAACIQHAVRVRAHYAINLS